MNTEETMVMIDLETMGNRAGAPLVEIGACAFNLTDGIFSNYAAGVSLASCMALGLKPDADTILWWLKQGEEARMAIAKNPLAIPLPAAAAGFSNWYRTLGDPARITVWGNGAGFDQPLLGAAYDAAAMEKPWRHSAERCYRTMKAAFPEVAPGPFEGVKHRALDDARHQAQHLMRILRRMRQQPVTTSAAPVTLMPFEGDAQ